MSEIKVDTLTGKTTAKTVNVTVGASATQSLEQGLVKAFYLFDQRGTKLGANTLGQSLNISSISDVSGGKISPSFTNSMSNSEYSPVCSAHYDGDNETSTRFSGPLDLTASSYEQIGNYANGSMDDNYFQSAVFGGLA